MKPSALSRRGIMNDPGWKAASRQRMENPMELPIFQLDAFATRLFGGNPAAVVILPEWLPDDVLQQIAQENNLSETAFFVPEGETYRLRWFTPTAEIELCGHATLASGYLLLEHLGRQLEQESLRVTAPDDEHDFVSRYFAPSWGVPEDPATGSAHCTLAPYWAARIGKTELRGYQASARGAEIDCIVTGDRVALGGACALYLEGRIRV